MLSQLLDIFSKRQKRRSQAPAVLQSDVIPHPLRVQIIRLIDDGFPHYDPCSYKAVSQGTIREMLLGPVVVETICDEHALLSLAHALSSHLPYPAQQTPFALLSHYILTIDNEKVLDVVEVAFRVIQNVVAGEYRAVNADWLIAKLNRRFLEHGVGYKFENGQIIRLDSEYVHQEAVEPLLKLIAEPAYEGVDEEFRKAHEHYRHGRHKETLNFCLKALESTMKVICDLRGWPYDKDRDTARALIRIMVDKGLFQTFQQAQINALRSLLESGVPTTRNRLGGHGQGGTPVLVPEETASLMITLTAGYMLFLIRREKKLKGK